MRDAMLRSVWQRDARDLYCLSQTRHSFGLALAILEPRDRLPTLWFPDYFTNNALAVVRAAAARIVFYPVTADLEPDWPACRALAAQQAPDLFVAVHYFGRRADTQAARNFCDTHSALLLEDATHLLCPDDAVGMLGDLTCYSPYKFLPIPDGALLAVRGEELARRMRVAARAMVATAAAAGPWVARRWLRTIRDVLHGTRPVRILRATTLEADPAPARPREGMWMSGYSRWRLAHAIRFGEFRALAEARLEAHRRITHRLAGWLQPVATTGQLIPYWTAMRAESEATERILNDLRAVGARVNTWPGLPPEVKADAGRHAAALKLRRTLLRFSLDRSRNHDPTDFLGRLT